MSGSSGSSTSSTGFQGSVSNLSQITATNTSKGSSNSANGPTTSNPFQSYYTYPQAAGMQSGSSNTKGSSGAFGGQLYYANISSSKTSNVTGTVGALKAAASYNTFGLKRDLPYTTVMGPTVGGQNAQFRPVNTQLQGALQDAVAQSPILSANRNVTVSLDGNTAVLKGFVETNRDSRIAEGLLRVTPGVRDVVNQLQVKNADSQ